MLAAKLIEQWLAHELPCEHLQVAGDGQHFEAIIVSSIFSGLPRIARQQRVNAILNSHFASGELHALSMRTLTPEEWATQQSRLG